MRFLNGMGLGYNMWWEIDYIEPGNLFVPVELSSITSVWCIRDASTCRGRLPVWFQAWMKRQPWSVYWLLWIYCHIWQEVTLVTLVRGNSSEMGQDAPHLPLILPPGQCPAVDIMVLGINLYLVNTHIISQTWLYYTKTRQLHQYCRYYQEQVSWCSMYIAP